MTLFYCSSFEEEPIKVLPSRSGLLKDIPTTETSFTCKMPIKRSAICRGLLKDLSYIVCLSKYL